MEGTVETTFKPVLAALAKLPADLREEALARLSAFCAEPGQESAKHQVRALLWPQTSVGAA